MECPKRCPNKTRCNKKTNLCQTPTVKCKKLNEVTNTCDPITTVKRCYTGTVRNKKTGDCENEFIRLCKKHILVSNLDHVLHTSWLTSKDCNLFMIGERHQEHVQCTSIFEMFKTLMKENLALPNPIQLDLMIEYLQQDLSKKSMLLKKDAQINFVRVYFENCIKQHTCPVHVHWTDPSETEASHPRNIPSWLSELAKTEWYDDAWTKNKKITPFFNKESDISKILTENGFVVKEIEKAAKVNPKFTLAFATKLFMEIYKHKMKLYKCKKWQKLAKIQTRHAMDFYTAARIIKSKMKHVIFYGGALHTETIIKILSALDFKLTRNVEGECF